MKHYAECNQFLEILTILEYIFIVNAYARQKIKKKYKNMSNIYLYVSLNSPISS